MRRKEKEGGERGRERERDPRRRRTKRKRRRGRLGGKRSREVQEEDKIYPRQDREGKDREKVREET